MIATAAVAILSAGFIFGWAVASNPGGRAERELAAEVAATNQPPPARSLSIPGEDVKGADIQGLPRYPGSVRIEYVREDQGRLLWTETEYLTDATLEQAREFYRDTFRSGQWSVNDIGFTQNSWVFFVVDGEREVFVELRPRGDIVEVDIEHTEPNDPATENTSTRENQETPDDPADYDEGDKDDYYDDEGYGD